MQREDVWTFDKKNINVTAMQDLHPVAASLTFANVKLKLSFALDTVLITDSVIPMLKARFSILFSNNRDFLNPCIYDVRDHWTTV